MISNSSTNLDLAIIIVTFNASATIARCLESILVQSVLPKQVILVDGLSTDRTVEIVQRYNDVISDFVCEADSGVYDAMNKGLKLNRSKYFLFLNSDDYFTNPNVLMRYNNVLKKNTFDVICCNILCVEGDKIRRRWLFEFGKDKFITATRIPHPGCLMKASFVGEVGEFDLKFSVAADFDLILRCLKQGATVAHIDEYLVKMEVGGLSDRGVMGLIKQNYEILSSLKKNKLPFPKIFLFFIDRIRFKITQKSNL